MNKVANLTVHRNTRDRRRRREIRQSLVSDAKKLSTDPFDGYAIVTWTTDHNARSAWLCGDTMPGSVMPEFVKRTIERSINKMDAEDVLD